MKNVVTKIDPTYKLIPSHQHQQNDAEKVIQTHKNHLLAGLMTYDPEYSINEWDLILFHNKLKPNLMKTSGVNPKLSAGAYKHEVFDVDCTSLARSGKK